MTLKHQEKDIEKGPDSHTSKAVDLRAGPSKKKTSTEDENLAYDPEDDVWELDEAKPSVGRKYARSLISAFCPVLYFSTCLGLFPLVPHRKKDGTYSVKFSWLSYATILFIMNATFIITATVWLIISAICVIVNVPTHPSTKEKSSLIYRSEEIFVYKRNTVALVIIFASFIHLATCMSAVFFRRHYIAKQLVYWTEVVELLQLDVGRNVAKRLWRHIVIILTFGLLNLIVYVFDASPGMAGSGSTFYIIMTRVIDPLSLWHGKMEYIRVIFGLILVHCVFCGYIYILWFLYNCRILANILRIWNNRFQYCLHKQSLDYTITSENPNDIWGVKSSNRTSRAQLFQDHLVIFNLLEGVNAQFEVIMESFYLTTMIMIVFEAYGFVHAIFYQEFIACDRQLDVIPIFLILVLQIYLYITVTLEAAGVADEARHVLDIVRRKGMMTSRLDNELWFMLSMRLSFGGHEDVGIIGAGFFYVTKSFLLGAISAIFSHFIIFYQFEVPYSQTIEADPNYKDLKIPELTEHLEGKSHRSNC